MLFANIIIDISHEKLDKTFQYVIPDDMVPDLKVGSQVNVPFGMGNRKITGYVVEITDKCEYDIKKLKSISSITRGSLGIDSELIALAAWIKRNYGGTMNQALKTVIPVKKEEKIKVKKQIELRLGNDEAMSQLAEYGRKHQTARFRTLEALIQNPSVAYETVRDKLNITPSVLRAMEEQGVIRIISQEDFRNPLKNAKQSGKNVSLNDMQRQIADKVINDINNGESNVYLLHGVTGSGKTEVYMELIADAMKRGKKAIVLIPEIALTFQTVMRFYNRFGDRVSILNSRMSAGERYDQYRRAREGHIDIMIGPRSALFTPFSDLGLIIIDEEHEGAYKSGQIPRYHARETAIERARMTGATVVLGSATPSTDSFYKAAKGEYKYLALTKRANEKPLPTCHIVDLREEMKRGNRGILSELLQDKIKERLDNHEQVMLFLNRRGLSGFVSCRACGEVIKCPHCDVSLSLHNNGTMACHYCGYTMNAVKNCPNCGSKYIGGFKAGTQKIEEYVKKAYPGARVLRMDFDTTRKKDSYEEILSAFANNEADILVGTQMIVKGHDFPNVTLVGILAADMSLNVSDYMAAERTFELLTQAAGRAGRGEKNGEVVLQTYQPEHYSIVNAKAQDYEGFYEQEIMYRSLMNYPPVSHMLVVHVTSENEDHAKAFASVLKKLITDGNVIGPAPAGIAKVNDVYRQVVYVKHPDYNLLVETKDKLERYALEDRIFTDVQTSFDFDPVS